MPPFYHLTRNLFGKALASNRSPLSKAPHLSLTVSKQRDRLLVDTVAERRKAFQLAELKVGKAEASGSADLSALKTERDVSRQAYWEALQLYQKGTGKSSKPYENSRMFPLGGPLDINESTPGYTPDFVKVEGEFYRNMGKKSPEDWVSREMQAAFLHEITGATYDYFVAKRQADLHGKTSIDEFVKWYNGSEEAYDDLIEKSGKASETAENLKHAHRHLYRLFLEQANWRNNALKSYSPTMTFLEDTFLAS